MAKAPVSEEILKEAFGPHLNYKPTGGWTDESVHPARKARTELSTRLSSPAASPVTTACWRAPLASRNDGARATDDEVRHVL